MSYTPKKTGNSISIAFIACAFLLYIARCIVYISKYSNYKYRQKERNDQMMDCFSSGNESGLNSVFMGTSGYFVCGLISTYVKLFSLLKSNRWHIAW